MTRGKVRRVAALEARRGVRRGVVIVWPDGVRDGWGRPAKEEGAALTVRLPSRPMTPGEIEAARGQA
ncbi:hypothetical protein QOL99_02930 [Deinococcus sp. MIMF12]|uniref:Uncharacterized protein n=1 Tax=Deinococcus rhizophilus TaxID=3049544 RepID=A0ABT7JHE6_9DEIO|nr:hypothetical protein [Deinococcus rhizophilus]MDL2343099.1 hypothetical protein [Deinococcus rhizophilus]